MPVLTQTDLQSLNTQQVEQLQRYTDAAAAAVDMAAAIPALTRTHLQAFDTEEEEALRLLFARLLPTGYLTWAAQRAAAGFELQQAFETQQVRDLLNATDKYAAYLASVD